MVSVYITADIDVLDRRLYERVIADTNTEKAYKTYEMRKEQNRKDLEEVFTLHGVFDAIIENTTPVETANEILSFFNLQK